MKVVINKCYGGFGVSREAAEFMASRGNKTAQEDLAEEEFYGYGQYERNDPQLVEAVETLGDKANGRFARLKVVEIPDGVEYEIAEYDGLEHIAEVHRIWG